MAQSKGNMCSRSLLWLGVVGGITGCASRQWDPEALAAAPSWVASLSHEQVDGTVTQVPQGSVRIVPPTVCANDCASALNKFVSALEADGVDVVAENAAYDLVFSEVSWEEDAKVPPSRMDLFAVGQDGRTPYVPEADTAERCKEAATAHGTAQGPRLSLMANVEPAGSDQKVASWSYSSTRPSAIDLVYRSTQVTNKWGYPEPPRNEYSPQQTLAMTAVGIGGFTSLAGIIWGTIGTRWSEFGRDGQTMAFVGVPLFIGGSYLLAKGNKAVRAHPAPVPETGFFKPVQEVLCVGKPTESIVDPGRVEAPAESPPPQSEDPSQGSSFDLSAPSAPTASTASPDNTLIGAAADDFRTRILGGGAR